MLRLLPARLNESLTFDVGDGSNVVFGRQDELVVDDPVGLVIQARRRMQLNDLVVLDGQVVTGALQMGDLHEESLHKCLANVDVVVFRGELGAGALQVEAVHDSGELLPNVVSRLQRSVVDEVFVAPLRVFVAWGRDQLASQPQMSQLVNLLCLKAW